ncbi:bifunctional hydroxymethylpyrimidine kinase/phosphomethylpyrimidine kinase [Campylobacter concisus]|uniref:bifunctional hydroxymethylpyrimidine kinase/phosphomethylpyrimidine kinase n=1 Tax=Campylobacter concisus TaxID=199 RepID=UPI001F3BEEAF|nr:bifunctional hydroxymethylpyrimidine kinase/phosphomethylpyrimidine kinase [Campylobacter concisus]
MSGTGYTFLASLACYLAKGKSLKETIGLFKEYICSIIKESIDTKLGVKTAYFGTERSKFKLLFALRLSE